MSTSRRYELVYIVSPDASEQEVADLHAEVEAVIARIGGELVKSENWGRRKMAYEIGPHKEGVYVLELISGGGEVMKELERRLRVSERSSAISWSAWTKNCARPSARGRAARCAPVRRPARAIGTASGRTTTVAATAATTRRYSHGR